MKISTRIIRASIQTIKNLHISIMHDDRYVTRTRFMGNREAHYMCDRFLSLFLTWYDTRSQAGVCQWSNCHSKTRQALLQKITDIIFGQGEWRSLFSSATPHPLFFVTLIIRHNLIGINMKYDTNLSGTSMVAQLLNCAIIKVWREWLPFTVIRIYLFFSHKL